MNVSFKIISDFNAELLARYLTNLEPERAVQALVAPFGQVYQELTAAAGVDRDEGRQRILVVWARPEALFESYRQALHFGDVDHDVVLREVDAFADLLTRQAELVRYLFVPAWILPPGHRGYGLLERRPGIGLSDLLARMNLHVAERLRALSNVFILDTEQWIRAAGARAAPPKFWYAAKVPYANAVFEAAALDLYAALDGFEGKSRRLLVVDLDNTLWGGVVGERGWQGITLGGHDHVGEAFVHFQQVVKSLSQRGIQLGIVSKNDEAVALEAIEQHPDMVLRRRDFAGWRINWDDKARNLAALVSELNLGLQSVVFLDDSAIERARVREALPDVLVPEWPADPAQNAATLSAMRCFDVPSLTREDRERAGMYAAERERRVSQATVGSLDEWLETLDIRVDAEPLSDANITRAAQLFNKTNQMNLATRRLSERELLDWAQDDTRRMWAVRVADKFGDSGLTGIVSVELRGHTAVVVDFLLSCRVMGRRVEDTMLHLAAGYARAHGATRIEAALRRTPRNAPTLAYFQQTDWERDGEHRFWRALTDTPALPVCIALTDHSAMIAGAVARPEVTAPR